MSLEEQILAAASEWAAERRRFDELQRQLTASNERLQQQERQLALLAEARMREQLGAAPFPTQRARPAIVQHPPHEPKVPG